MFEDEFTPLSPINFFQITADCKHTDSEINPNRYKPYLLPNTSDVSNEEYFADVAMGWHREGIELLVNIREPFHQAYYPDVSRGDSVELFFDTRDVKTSGFNTRFCHHFFFLPEAIDGQIAGEITRFRTEDVHELCDPKELKVRAQFKKNGYLLNISIPSHSLYGYDPEQFDRLGFSYRINRAGRASQHFSVLTEDYQIEQQPSLWSSLRLVT